MKRWEKEVNHLISGINMETKDAKEQKSDFFDKLELVDFRIRKLN